MNVWTGAPVHTGNVNAVLGHLRSTARAANRHRQRLRRATPPATRARSLRPICVGIGMGTEGTGITYSRLELLDIDLGSAGDTFTIFSTHGSHATLDTWNGGDTFIIRTVAGHTVITTGDGEDVVPVGSLANATGGALRRHRAATSTASTAYLESTRRHGSSDHLLIDDSGETNGDIGRMTHDDICGFGTTLDAQHTGGCRLRRHRADPRGRHLHPDHGRPGDGADRLRRHPGGGRARHLMALGVTAADVTVTRSPVIRTTASPTASPSSAPGLARPAGTSPPAANGAALTPPRPDR